MIRFLMRVADDEFWFSLSDLDIGLYLQGVNADKRFNVEIDEIDACPVQIQGPKSKALMKDLIGDQVDLDNMPFYGLAEAKVEAEVVLYLSLDFLVKPVMRFILETLLCMQKTCGMLYLKGKKT